MPKPQAVVSGSFRRHLDSVRKAVRELTAMGVSVLSPSDAEPIAQEGSFVILKSDRHRDVKRLEEDHLRAIDECDFLWLVAPDGVAGQSTCLEVGYALAKEKPIYTEAMFTDTVLAVFAHRVDSVGAMLSLHSRER
jgi:nucleoside 2-deoxyribosyltransferase